MGRIAELVSATPTAVSQHLAKLRLAGLVQHAGRRLRPTTLPHLCGHERRRLPSPSSALRVMDKGCSLQLSPAPVGAG
ncbi:MAG TPA: ArsR family transcriptional regulator [Dermatophilaceae bacterium]